MAAEKSDRHPWRQWFLHGPRSSHNMEWRHKQDIRDHGFVPLRCLLGFAPMAGGLIGLLEWYPSSSFYDNGSLWTDPVLVPLLTTVTLIYMFITPLIGMAGPDPGWDEKPPRINYSLSHMIDDPWLMSAMSTAWVYPASLLWATEYRVDWLQAHEKPGGFFEFLSQTDTVFAGNGILVARRISLWVWQLAFIGFLMVTDSTKWALHMGITNIFAAALVVHALTSVVAQGSGDRSVSLNGSPPWPFAQVSVMCSAALGLVAFLSFNMFDIFPCVKKGVGYWYWFAEVWALGSILWFTPVRLFCDEKPAEASFAVVSICGTVIAVACGLLPVLPKTCRDAILPGFIVQQLLQRMEPISEDPVRKGSQIEAATT